MNALGYLLLACFVTCAGAFAAAYAPGIAPAYRASLAFLTIWVVPSAFIACMIKEEAEA